MPSLFLAMFGIAHPIIQAPMAGGATTPELVAAVSNAGALGSFAAATLSPAAIAEGVQRVRALTSQPFNVNLFVLEEPAVDEAALASAQERLEPYRAALGLGAASRPTKFCENNQAQIAALLALAPPVVSFTFGVLDAGTVAQFREKGSLVIGTATTVAEAKAWEAAGANAICVQGIEAGGHRGTFLGDFEQAGIGLMALIPQVARAVHVPLIAAGGIMDGKGIAAALVLGAQAAQLGTAFLCCPEAGIHPGWKQRIALTSDDGTRLTRLYSGKYARGIVTDFMEQLRPFEQDVPPYPIQNALTGEIRQAAGKQNRLEMMSLWAGQGAGLARALPAAQLVHTLTDELIIALPKR
jgi:nitronate monooxygenase